jgi:hypothetical protein
MFDREKNDDFKDGDKFTLESFRYVGPISTVHGPALKSIAMIKRPGEQKATAYGLLGAGFAQQAQSVEAGDLPREVEYKLVPTGNGDRKVKLLEPVIPF